MAHVPDLGALSLSRLVPIGARKKKAQEEPANASARKKQNSPPPALVAGMKKKSSGDVGGSSAKKAKKEEEAEARAKFKEELDEHIRDLLKAETISDGDDDGWKPKRDPKSKEPIDPNPNQRCCTVTTGSRLEDHLPESLRAATDEPETPPTAAPAPRVIDDPEGWAQAQQEQEDAAMQKRLAMSQEEWMEAYGGKRQAQIESIKKSLNGYKRYRHYVPPRRRSEGKRTTTHPVTPDHNDRRYSKRGWAGAVRLWTDRVHGEWGSRPDDPKPRRAGNKAKASEESNECESEC